MWVVCQLGEEEESVELEEEGGRLTMFFYFGSRPLGGVGV